MSVLHIVHPYTYKLKGDTLVIGPIEEFKERDSLVAPLVKSALDNGIRVLHYRSNPEESISGGLENLALKLDPAFEILFDSRIECVAIPRTGKPIPDDKPEKISAENWEYWSKNFISCSEFERVACKNDENIFIGGVLECCVAGLVDHYLVNKLGEHLCVVEEICVSRDTKEKMRIISEFKRYGVEILSYASALKLLKRPSEKKPEYNKRHAIIDALSF